MKLNTYFRSHMLGINTKIFPASPKTKAVLNRVRNLPPSLNFFSIWSWRVWLGTVRPPTKNSENLQFFLARDPSGARARQFCDWVFRKSTKFEKIHHFESDTVCAQACARTKYFMGARAKWLCFSRKNFGARKILHARESKNLDLWPPYGKNRFFQNSKCGYFWRARSKIQKN